MCDQIVSRTHGVPLLVEELTKAVPKSGLLRDIADRYELIGPLPPRTIPATLHGSLLARLASDGPDLRNVHHRIPAISASHSDRPNRKEDPIGRSKGRIGAG